MFKFRQFNEVVNFQLLSTVKREFWRNIGHRKIISFPLMFVCVFVYRASVNQSFSSRKQRETVAKTSLSTRLHVLYALARESLLPVNICRKPFNLNSRTHTRTVHVCDVSWVQTSTSFLNTCHTIVIAN